MAKPQTQTVILEQWDNCRVDHDGGPPTFETRYIVKQTTNTTQVAVGQRLELKAVNCLIKQGTKVIIKASSA